MIRAVVAVAILALTACGGDGELEVRDAWARPTPLVSTPAAVYFELEVAEDDVLLGASAPDVAAVAEVHETMSDDGVMSMHESHGVELRAGEPVAFEPGGLHVMLVDLFAPLEEGQRFDLTLTLERAGDITVEVEVRN